MKQASIILSALLALLISGCSSDSTSPDPDIKPETHDAVTFGAYSGKFADTRAAQPSNNSTANMANSTANMANSAANMTNSAARLSTRAGNTSGNMNLNDLEKVGFGVFAYSTGTAHYQSAADTPNFMYNQLVADTARTGNWNYSPLRYWPNSNVDESGTVTPQYVSFFAYAPHATGSYASHATGSASATGITGFSSNSATGDPTVDYSLGTRGTNIVDLLWATDEAGSPLTDRTIANMTSGNTEVKFYFHHALTKIGGTLQEGDQQAGMTINLSTDANGNLAGTSNPLSDTKVTVSKIRLEVIGMENTATGIIQQSFYSSGAFNLNSGSWTFNANNLAGIDTTAGKMSNYSQLITTADSAKALNADATINNSIAEPSQKKYIVNPAMPDGKLLLWDSIPAGVTQTPQNVYAIEAVPLLIIPTSGYKPVLRLSVTYTVRTKDPCLFGGYSHISETLSRTFTLNEEPQPAHRYHIAIHLGLHQLRLDGNIEEWQVTHGSIIWDATARQWQQGPDIREDDPSGQDTTWLAKKHGWNVES